MQLLPCNKTVHVTQLLHHSRLQVTEGYIIHIIIYSNKEYTLLNSVEYLWIVYDAKLGKYSLQIYGH